MAQAYNCRPSQLIDVQDPYAAYCFDEAVYLWASYVRNAVTEAGEQIKGYQQKKIMQQRVLQTLLRTREQVAAEEIPKGMYRDPATLFNRGK